MDLLAGLLDGPRARSAFVMRSAFNPPWSLRIEDRAPLTVVAVTRGTAWMMSDAGSADRLAAGDLVICRGPDGYTMADDPSTPPLAVIHPGQLVLGPDGAPLCEALGFDVRGWGPAPDGATGLVTGTYENTGEVCARLLRALPAVVVLRRGEVDDRLVELLVAESARDEPGQGAVLDRLLDLLVVAALRAWFARDEAPSWYHAYGDPMVGTAMRMMQHEPDRPWTVADLATAVGASRAALARRFTDLVGAPPMAFLTEWRLALAADLLRGTDATLESVARKVGYSSAFALSTAFKRHHGVSPREYRRAAS
ncbi:MAG: AraC family transcriptional regulator [Mycobacteriaceae bacterium]|nr:AraC family transcriptional regulator [Mycobacteriaceae bacterium]